MKISESTIRRIIREELLREQRRIEIEDTRDYVTMGWPLSPQRDPYKELENENPPPVLSTSQWSDLKTTAMWPGTALENTRFLEALADAIEWRGGVGCSHSAAQTVASMYSSARISRYPAPDDWEEEYGVSFPEDARHIFRQYVPCALEGEFWLIHADYTSASSSDEDTETIDFDEMEYGVEYGDTNEPEMGQVKRWLTDLLGGVGLPAHYDPSPTQFQKAQSWLSAWIPGGNPSPETARAIAASNPINAVWETLLGPIKECLTGEAVASEEAARRSPHRQESMPVEIQDWDVTVYGGVRNADRDAILQRMQATGEAQEIADESSWGTRGQCAAARSLEIIALVLLPIGEFTLAARTAAAAGLVHLARGSYREAAFELVFAALEIKGLARFTNRVRQSFSAGRMPSDRILRKMFEDSAMGELSSMLRRLERQPAMESEIEKVKLELARLAESMPDSNPLKAPTQAVARGERPEDIARIYDEAVAARSSRRQPEESPAVSDDAADAAEDAEPDTIELGREDALSDSDIIELQPNANIPPVQRADPVAGPTVQRADSPGQTAPDSVQGQPGTVAEPERLDQLRQRIQAQVAAARQAPKIPLDQQEEILSHFSSESQIQEFGAEITDFIRTPSGRLDQGAESRVFRARSIEHPGPVVVKVINKESRARVAGATPENALSAARWIMQHRSSLPAELQQHLPIVYKVGTTTDLDGTQVGYMVVEELRPAPVFRTSRTTLNPHPPATSSSPEAVDVHLRALYMQGFPRQQMSYILEDQQRLYSYVRSRLAREPGIVDNLQQEIISEELIDTYARDVVRYYDNPDTIPADIRGLLDDVEFSSVQGYQGYARNPNPDIGTKVPSPDSPVTRQEIRLLKAEAAARIKMMDSILDDITQFASGNRTGAPAGLERLDQRALDRLHDDIYDFRDEIEDLIRSESWFRNEMARHHVNLFDNPPIARDFYGGSMRNATDPTEQTSASAPFERDPFMTRMAAVDNELRARGLVKGDVHYNNVRMGPNGDLVYADFGLFQVLPPGSTYRVDGAEYSVIDPGSPLQNPDMFRISTQRDPSLRPNPQFDEEDVVRGTKYNPLEEGIDLDRWKLLAGIS